MPKKIVITKLGGPEVLKYVDYELESKISKNSPQDVPDIFNLIDLENRIKQIDIEILPVFKTKGVREKTGELQTISTI